MALVTYCGRWHLSQHPQFIISKNLKIGDAPWVSSIQRRAGRRCSNKTQRKLVVRSSCRTGLSHPRSLPSLRLRRNFSTKFSETDSSQTEEQRPPFNLDLAVLLAGFAFESYNTPDKTVGVKETDGGHCQTVYLSDEFLRTIYDGQLFVNLNRGTGFPGLDLWGTSDPFVVFQIGDCSVRSRTSWVTKDPSWNEKLVLNIKTSAARDLEVAAWDENLVTTNRRLGNGAVSLENVYDGNEWYSILRGN